MAYSVPWALGTCTKDEESCTTVPSDTNWEPDEWETDLRTCSICASIYETTNLSILAILSSEISSVSFGVENEETK